MTFKESVDLSDDVFFDADAFAEEHRLEYQTVLCVLDTDIHARDTNHEKGKKDIRIFIPQAEADKYPECFPKSEGESLNVDGSEYLVESWALEMGTYVVYAFRYGE